jgi:predicted ATP-dependent endonuclease of OLD family
MKLTYARIRRYRSIEQVDVPTCGALNVLIGKNNSGKSNVLSAISIFFQCLGRGSAVTLNPPVGDEIDFFERDTRQPIEIELTFCLSVEERSVLGRDIAAETPQMKNAVDALAELPALSCTLAITPPPTRFGYISSIVVGPTPAGTLPEKPNRNLLTIAPAAAEELRANLSVSQRSARDEEALRRLLTTIDADDWRRIKASEGGRPPFPYLFRNMTFGSSPSAEIQELVTGLFSTCGSFAEFEGGIQSASSRFHAAAEAAATRPLANFVGTFSGEQSALPGYANRLLTSLAGTKVLYLTEQRKAIGREEATRLLSLKVKRGGAEDLQRIQQTVAALLDVKIDAFESSAGGRRGDTPLAELDVNNFLVEVNGSGIREALRLVLDVEFRQPNILLVEEPETHLHPALETGMMRYLQRISSQCQVFLSTHSTNFLDTGEMKNVYLVSKEGSTSVQPLNIEAAEAELPRELGIRLSSVFMFDRLVFVEGASDEDILREWADKLEVNLSQQNVGFIHMGGVRNFTHFASQATMAFLSHRRVRMWFVLDRDEKDRGDVEKVVKALDGRAETAVLRKREIENYLIVPRAIRKLMEIKSEKPAKLSESDIVKAIDECADELKELAVEKRVVKSVCGPVYASAVRVLEGDSKLPVAQRTIEELDRMAAEIENRKKTIEKSLAEARSDVEREWPRRKTELVPGDLLLDRVMRRAGLRFRKEKDGARLARVMTKDELDEEMTKLIVGLATG